jgi:hypothetical protein
LVTGIIWEVLSVGRDINPPSRSSKLILLEFYIMGGVTIIVSIKGELINTVRDCLPASTKDKVIVKSRSGRGYFI